MATQLVHRPTLALVTDTPRIYVACLAAYNAGRLHGTWLDVGDDVGLLQDGVNAMLARSPEPDAEEWAIHDYEGFASNSLSEHTGLEQVIELAAFTTEHGEIGARVLDHFGGDIDDASKALDESYAGRHDSLESFAKNLLDETGELAGVPERFRYYIDFEAMGRDMELNGDVYTIETGYQQVHVFWNW